jgi:peptidoglycan hydrolase-like protein with peptidoglycan-binding domain
MNNKFTVRISDFLIATLITFSGLAFANAQSITVQPVPVHQVLGVPYVTFSTSTNSTAGVIIGGTVNGNICVQFNTLQKRGQSGNKVLALQKALNKYNNAGLNETGYFGVATENAVKNFQYKYGISPVSGIVWTKTNFVLNKLDCGGNVSVVNNMQYKNSTKTIFVNNKKIYTKKHVDMVKVYDKAGNITTDATGAPTNVTYGTSKNVTNNSLSEVLKNGKIVMEKATKTATTTQIVKTGFINNLKNIWNSFWYNYKANFLK